MRIYGSYDFNGHLSVQLTEQKSRGCKTFDFREKKSDSCEKSAGNSRCKWSYRSGRYFIQHHEGWSLGNISITLYSLQLVHQKGSVAMWLEKRGPVHQSIGKMTRASRENYRPVTVLSCKQSVRTLTGEPKVWWSSWWWPQGLSKAQ